MKIRITIPTTAMNVAGMEMITTKMKTENRFAGVHNVRLVNFGRMNK